MLASYCNITWHHNYKGLSLNFHSENLKSLFAFTLTFFTCTFEFYHIQLTHWIWQNNKSQPIHTHHIITLYDVEL